MLGQDFEALMARYPKLTPEERGKLRFINSTLHELDEMHRLFAVCEMKEILMASRKRKINKKSS